MTFVQMSQVQKQKQENMMQTNTTVQLVIIQLTCFSSHIPYLLVIASPFLRPPDPNDESLFATFCCDQALTVNHLPTPCKINNALLSKPQISGK